MEENFSMEWKIFSTEWKKIASMEYRKIVFHSIPYHALSQGLQVAQEWPSFQILLGYLLLLLSKWLVLDKAYCIIALVSDDRSEISLR